jgi:hypothetical protein
MDMLIALRSNIPVRFNRRRGWLCLLALLLLTSSMITACSGLFGTTKPTATPTPSVLPLAQLHWCGKPQMLFRDEGATPTPGATASATATASPTASATASATPTTPTPSGPRTLTDWAQVEPLLGFTVYLPPRLPRQTCLVSALGTVHDPIFGGNFSISYLLPDGEAISLSEAPLRNQKPIFQCNASLLTPTATTKAAASPTVTSATATAARATPTRTPNQICSGVRGQTSIVFSAPGDQKALKQFFDALQPNVPWVPVS